MMNTTIVPTNSERVIKMRDSLVNMTNRAVKAELEVERLQEQVQERDGVIEVILLRELRLREALEDAERVLAWGEPGPQPVLQRVRAALAGKEEN